MRLWQVTVESVIVMASRCEPDDFDIRSAVIESIGDECGETCCQELTNLGDVPQGWLKKIPYGDEVDESCEKIMAALAAEREAKALKKPMPNQKELPL